jgi:hypothetical protein
VNIQTSTWSDIAACFPRNTLIGTLRFVPRSCRLSRISSCGICNLEMEHYHSGVQSLPVFDIEAGSWRSHPYLNMTTDAKLRIWAGEVYVTLLASFGKVKTWSTLAGQDIGMLTCRMMRYLRGLKETWNMTGNFHGTVSGSWSRGVIGINVELRVEFSGSNSVRTRLTQICYLIIDMRTRWGRAVLTRSLAIVVNIGYVPGRL